MNAQREAIEKALMHLAYGGGVHKAQEILRAALAEQPQPVAWLFVLDGCRQVMLDEDADEAIRHHGIPLYRHPPAAFTLVDGVDPARIKDFDVTAYGRDGDGFDRTP